MRAKCLLWEVKEAKKEIEVKEGEPEEGDEEEKGEVGTEIKEEW